MTEEQLKTAAYEYCRLKGLDPEIRVQHSAPVDDNGGCIALCMLSPRWVVVADELRNVWIQIEAIKFAE